jgi:hypothetical protein
MFEEFDDYKSVGAVERIIEYKDGRREVENVRNTILKHGRMAFALSLANQIGDSFDFYITRMLFGDGGTANGAKKYVNSDRNGLFGVTRLSKPILANIDANVRTQVIFTSVIKYDEAVGVTLNEMALQMSSGDLFSMTTFPDLTKTEEMQITFNWRISMV